jgi:diketogulonate reductase-like aldo/keto reductase
MTTQIPLIGLGTWNMGERRASFVSEVDAILHALRVGYRLIDTAELYADGACEQLVGAALKAFGHNMRDRITVVSKVLPSNASRKQTITACQRSLDRLGLEQLDVYLLHWHSRHPYAETIEAFLTLQESGLIKRWGVSNFDTDDLAQWLAVEKQMGIAPEKGCLTNQVYYSLMARGPEFDLLPAMQQRDMPLMAYTPLGSGELASHTELAALASSMGLTAAQLALSWVVRSGRVCAIPKSVTLARITENFAAVERRLAADELAAMDRIFPPPRSKQPLAVI